MPVINIEVLQKRFVRQSSARFMFCKIHVPCFVLAELTLHCIYSGIPGMLFLTRTVTRPIHFHTPLRLRVYSLRQAASGSASTSSCCQLLRLFFWLLFVPACACQQEQRLVWNRALLSRHTHPACLGTNGFLFSWYPLGETTNTLMDFDRMSQV